MPEQRNLPFENKFIANNKKEKGLTEDEMRKIYLEIKGKGSKKLEQIRKDYKERMEREKQEMIKKLAENKIKESYKEGDGNDYKEYIEMEKVKALWGPGYYPLSKQRRDTGASERVKVFFGSDGEWHVGGKIVNDTFALGLIENDEDEEGYKEIVRKIQEIKDKLKK